MYLHTLEVCRLLCPTIWEKSAQNGNINVGKLLLGAGTDVESKDEWGTTPLSCAAKSRHQEVVKFLVKKGGADVASNVGASLSIY